jgi:hypothetical protein
MPLAQDCWHDNIKLIYDVENNTYHNQEGVSINT